MIPLEQALATLLANVTQVADEEVPLAEAAGRILRERVPAPRPVPPADNAGLDGVAFRAADVRGATAAAPVTLRLVGEVAAGGRREQAVQAGEAVRIMTGAPLPVGVDTVLGVEVLGFEAGAVRIAEAPEAGANVRRAGEDLSTGTVPVAPGTRLAPAALGVLASMGRDRVRVARRPRVAILATGNELLAPGAPWREGAIYSSNSLALAALAAEAGAHGLDLGLVSDDPQATGEALERASTADAVLTSGGVSMGEYDHVRSAAERIGFEPVFWQVAIKPGKPFFFARRGPTLLFGLPGNPASALLVFEELVRPALLAMQGAARVDVPLVQAILDAPLRQRPGRLGLVRATLRWVDGVPFVRPQVGQGSGILSSLASAEAILRVPPHVTELRAGERVLARLLGWRAPT